MSCDSYLNALKPVIDGLVTRAHGHIDQDLVPDSAVARVQTDVPTLGIQPITIQGANPSGSLNIQGGEFASVFVSHENPWWEDWIVTDMARFEAPTHQIWMEKTGSSFKAALPGFVKTAGSGAFRWLPMGFEYKELPDTLQGALQAIDAAHACASHAHVYEFYNVVQYRRFEKLGGAVVPSGFLYRYFIEPDAAGSPRVVDFWILEPDYRPPKGARRVALIERGIGPARPSEWLASTLGALRSNPNDADPAKRPTFVCIPVTAKPLP